MRDGPQRLQDLAREAKLDLDDALIRLWEAGIDYVFEPNDCVKRIDLAAARTALSLESAQELRSITAWSHRLGLTEAEFREQLPDLGITVTPAMRNLPKGAIAKLRKHNHTAKAMEGSNSSHFVADAVTPPLLPPLDWRPIGRYRDSLQYLTPEEIAHIHEYLVDLFALSGDPIIPAGVKYPDLLASAADRPRTGIGGVRKYPTAEMAAAALLHSLTLNHPFHNGNKRAALVSMLVFLDRNDVALTADEAEVLKLVIRVTRRSLFPPETPERSDRETQDIATWIYNNQRTFTHGDRSLQFRVLRRILRGFGCEFKHPSNGNRISIERVVEERAIFRTRTVRLETQVYYRNEGADVARNTINKIRHDLQMDEEHGCDSSAFYSSNIDVIDQVIAQYQTTLKRLAKL